MVIFAIVLNVYARVEVRLFNMLASVVLCYPPFAGGYFHRISAGKRALASSRAHPKILYQGSNDDGIQVLRSSWTRLLIEALPSHTTPECSLLGMWLRTLESLAGEQRFENFLT